MPSTTTASLEAVAELIRTQRLRIDITPSVSYEVRAPCLLTQLEEAVTLGTEGGGRGVPSSRAPIAIDAADLWSKISYNTHGLAHHLGLNRKDPTPGSSTPWVGRLLRHVAAEAVSRGLDKTADRIEHNARKWAAQIETMLTGRAERRALRGAECPNCTQIRPYPRRLIGPWAGPQPTNTVIDDRPGDGTYRVPAIELVAHNSLRWRVCRACGWNEPIVDPHPEVVYTAEVFDEAGVVVV